MTRIEFSPGYPFLKWRFRDSSHIRENRTGTELSESDNPANDGLLLAALAKAAH
jgi:hypothetical protein